MRDGTLRHRPSGARLVALTLALLISVACINELPAAVTCAKVRALRFWMTTDDVVGLIGPPISRGHGREAGQPDESSEIWNYDGEHSGFGNGVRFHMSFQNGRLTGVSSYYKHIWNERSVSLYDLSGAIRTESPEFARYFSCSL